ncbi:hypothetical protein JXI42_14515 [bacterium]|nr:hypothetical protein [bacterium]
MLAWLIWFIISLIPALVVLIGKMSVQTLALIYFLLIIAVIIGWGIHDKIKKRSLNEV